MINAIEKNLNRGIRLLQHITDQQYSDTSIGPYHSSIGTHMRHILDVYSCVIDGLETRDIDLTKRKRNALAEQKTAEGLAYFDQIIAQLCEIEEHQFSEEYKVTDNMGSGNITTVYSLGAILMQAHSHAIHHFASVGIIIHQLGIGLPDADFGYNPTTPKQELTH